VDPAARWHWATELRGPTLDLRLALVQPSGETGVDVRAVMRYRNTTYVRSETIELTVAATEVRVLRRDLVVQDLPRGGAAHADRWTAKWAELRVPASAGDGTRGTVHLTVRGGPELEGLALHRRGPLTSVRLELDDVRNHPFRPRRDCLPRYVKNAPLVPRDERIRRAGEVVEYTAHLAMGQRRGVPVWLHRWPAGHLAALTFTSHADQSGESPTRAVLYGVGRRTHADHGRGGFLGHGLTLTQSFFWRLGRKHPQLGESAPLLALAQEAARKGVEIIPHSVTPLRDSRATTRQGLAFFQQWKAVTWIDHEPESNCEGFSNRGAVKGHPNYLADLLHHFGYRYVWAGKDAEGLPWKSLNLLDPFPLDQRRAFMFNLNVDPVDAPQGFWIWYSNWMYYKRALALAFWSDHGLDRLENQRGVHVAHVYLDAAHPPSSWLHAYNLLDILPDGTPRLSPGFDQVLASLARRLQRGTLWTTTFARLADHLVDSQQVVVSQDPEARAARVTNRGRKAISGITLTIATAPSAPRVNGQAPAGVSRHGGYTFLWFDLPGGTSATVTW
jgi:hypothetical protein